VKNKAILIWKADSQTGGAKEGVQVSAPTINELERKTLQCIPPTSIVGIAGGFDSLRGEIALILKTLQYQLLNVF
jgi:hypothetical protein